jgi:HSF-type DNA-binding
MMSRRSHDQDDHRRINNEETKAQEDLLLLMRMHSRLPILQAQATLQHHQQQSQLLRQRFLQSTVNPLLNLQTSLSLAAALNPGLGMASSQFQFGLPSMSCVGTLASTETLLRQLPQSSGLHDIRNSIQMIQSSGLGTALSQSLRLPASISTQQGATESDEKGKRDPVHAFPTRLHDILSTKEYNDYVAWLPHGRAWRILNKSQFEKKVIPHHFRHARYASFMRQASCVNSLCAYYVLINDEPTLFLTQPFMEF